MEALSSQKKKMDILVREVACIETSFHHLTWEESLVTTKHGKESVLMTAM